jgi:alkylation response protein AidB-like acyl-CoA dehydrogenase
MAMLNEGDQQIVDSAARLLAEIGGITHARRAQHAQRYFDRNAWERMAEAGWLGAVVEPQLGGAGLSLRELLLILEECGSRAAPEPLVLALGASVVLPEFRDVEAAELLKEVVAGKRNCAPIVPGFYGRNSCQLTLANEAISGVTPPVFDAHGADLFLLGIEIGREFQICTVQRTTLGVHFDLKDTVDGGTLGQLRFESVARSELRPLYVGNRAKELLNNARDIMRLGYCAQLVGVMREAFQTTLEYLKLRKQFGTPIGAFQAIQHRMATLHIEIRSSRALLYEACAAVGTERQALAAASAKAQISDVAMRVVKEGVQLHGAIGYTDEHDMSLYFRRAMSLTAAGGDSASCLKDVARFIRGTEVH